MIVLNKSVSPSGFLLLFFVLHIAGCSCDLKNESTEDVRPTSAESKSTKNKDTLKLEETSENKKDDGSSGNPNQQTLKTEDTNKDEESKEISRSVVKSKSESSPKKTEGEVVQRKSARAGGIPSIDSSKAVNSSNPGEPDRYGSPSNRSGRGRSTDLSPSSLGKGSSDVQSADGKENGSGIPKKDEERPRTTRFRNPS